MKPFVRARREKLRVAVLDALARASGPLSLVDILWAVVPLVRSEFTLKIVLAELVESGEVLRAPAVGFAVWTRHVPHPVTVRQEYRFTGYSLAKPEPEPERSDPCPRP